MQHATERVERPGESQEALDGKKMLFFFTEPVTEPFVLLNGPVAECVGLLGRQKKGLNVLASHNGRSMEKKKPKTGQCTKRISESRAQQRGKKLFNCEKQQQDCSGTREALLSEAGFEKVFRPRIGPVGGICFVDDFVSCWGKRDAYRLLLEPS